MATRGGAFSLDSGPLFWQRFHASLTNGSLSGVVGLRGFVLNQRIESIMKTKQVLLLALSALSTAHAQGTAFTYQGQLSASGSPASGHYDFTFALFNTNSTNSGQAGGT